LDLTVSGLGFPALGPRDLHRAAGADHTPAL